MLQDAAESSDALSVDEFMSVLHGLTDAQLVRLREIARFHGKACGTEGDDMINQAIYATTGKRKCPRDVDPIAYLAETMRSISDGIRRKARRIVPIDHKTIDKDGQSIPFEPVDGSPNPEQQLGTDEAARAIRSAILDLFGDNTQARDFAEGVMAGLEGEELREYTGLQGTAFNTMRRQFRRKVDAAYPDGWKI